jgi:cephalosporin-C deacetylase-like acetyl esterase
MRNAMNRRSRRQFLQWASALPLAPGLLRWPLAFGQGSAAAVHSYSEDLPDMLVSYITSKTNAWAAKWDQVRSEIHTAADLEKRNQFVREKIREMLGGFPERNPLGPIVTRVQQRPGYRVENVMFQSRPNFWVTANLYVPTAGSGPFPGIISPCGHYAPARIYEPYQFLYHDLVKSGFVVLAYDPIGQGERRQFWNPQTNRDDIGGSSTWEHDMPGHLLFLLGENLTEYRIWDGMRAIDYLETRPEVDAKRIGCTGHSGGGTLTLFISALNDRVRCAVMNEGGYGRRWPMKIGPGDEVGTGDVEQHFFPAGIYGIDLFDTRMTVAPRPVLGTIEHYSPEYNEQTERLRAGYRLLGAPEALDTEAALDPHALTFKLRMRTTDWFCRWFYHRPGPTVEPDFTPEAPEALYCTPNGSIRYSPQGETIFSRILKKGASLPPSRKIPASRADWDVFRREIGDEIRELLRFHASDAALGVRLLETTPRRGYHIEKVEFLSEPGIYIPAWVFLPEENRVSAPAILYVEEAGTANAGMEFGTLEQLARKGHSVIAVDVRGMGSTRPNHPDMDPATEFTNLEDAQTAMAYWAWEINESLFGMRVQDVLRSVDYALSRSDVPRSGVRLIGKGQGALWALFAAALDSRILATVCDGGLLSYRHLTQGDTYLYSADVIIPDVLNHMDLPYVAAAVADRSLALLAPLDAMKNTVDMKLARATYQWTEAAYRAAGVQGRFRLSVPGGDLSRVDLYLELLS